MDEEVRRIRMRIMADPEYGVVALSKMRREAYRLWRDRAAGAREDSRATRFTSRTAREERAAEEERGIDPAPETG